MIDIILIVRDSGISALASTLRFGQARRRKRDSNQRK